MKSRTKINIYELQQVTYALGPGKRFAIWVQGCPFNCQGCMTPDSIPFRKEKVYTITRLVEKIKKVQNLEGITISGGEPFMQAEQISELIQKIKDFNPFVNYIVYSGFKLDRLKWNAAKKLLKEIDVLIDGLYVNKLNNNKGIRGSTNQKIHFITNRLIDHKRYFEEKERNQEKHRKKDGILFVGLRPNLQNLKL